MKTLRICVMIGYVACYVMCFSFQAKAGAKGDIDPFPGVDLRDAILCLQIMANLNPTVKAAISDADVNGDGKIGLEEEIYILQVIAGLRTDGDGAPAPFTGIVARHNYWRYMVGSPGLTWSSQLATAAQEWADTLKTTCQPKHKENIAYGQNIAGAGGTTWTPQQVTDYWADEKNRYVYGAYLSGMCENYPDQYCGHYTQLVWKNTTQIGCGKTTCSDGYYTWEIWVCNYSPAGNVKGQFPY